MRGPKSVYLLPVLGILYFLAGKLGLALATIHVSASPVWPPTGIAIAAAFLFGTRVWPAITVGAFLFNVTNVDDLSRAFASGDHILVSFLIAVGNTLEGIVGAWLVRRFSGDQPFDTSPNAFRFALVGGGIAPAISATIGVGSLAALGLAPASDVGAIWATWWLGDAGGALLVAPVIILWAESHRFPARGANLAESIFAYAAIVVATVVVFGGLFGPQATIGIGPLLLPLLLWPLVRLGRRDAMTSALIIAAGAVVGTMLGRGPLQRSDPNEALLLVQVVLMGASVALLGTIGAFGSTRPGGAAGRAAFPAALSLIPLVIGSVFAGAVLGELTGDLANDRANQHATRVTTALSAAVEANVDRLYSLRAFVDRDPNITRSDFQHYVDRSLWVERVPGVQAIELSRAVAHGDERAFQDSVRNDTSVRPHGYPDFEIHPASEVPVHFVVDYLVPYEGNEAVHGLDLTFTPSRFESINRTMASGTAALTPTVDLVQASGSEPGFLILLALETPHPRAGTPGHPEDLTLGLVNTVHSANDLVTNALTPLGDEVADVGLEIYDVTGIDMANPDDVGAPMFDTDGVAKATTAPGTWHFIEHGGRTWGVFLPAHEFLSGAERAIPWLVVGASVALSILIASLTYVHGTTAARARRLADRATADLTRMNKDLESFAYAVSHDLQQPLNTVDGYLDLLEEELGEMHGDAKDFFTRARSGSKRLRQLIQALLAYSRAGRDLRFEWVDLDELLAEVRAEFPPEADIRLGRTGSVRGDRGALATVFRNLISNGLKFRRPDVPPVVDVRAVPGPGGLIVDVADNGIGIAPEYREQVFDVFRRLHTQEQYSGTGIGLSLVRRVLELHGAEVDIYDTPGGGATFKIRFNVGDAL